MTTIPVHDYSSFMQSLDRQSAETSERVRAILREAGRLDVLAEYDAKMKDIRLGIDSARGCWHALSETQRGALRLAQHWNGRIYRFGPNVFGQSPTNKPTIPVRLATVRNLIARELLACEGGAFDPEHVLVLTERGRFVLKHGPAP